MISELMAINDSTLRDENGDYSDWIEIYNPTGAAVGNGGSAGQFDFCTTGYDQLSRLVNVTPNGRVAVKKQAGLCGGS